MHPMNPERTRLPGTPAPMHRLPGAEGLMLAADSWGDPGQPSVLLLHGGGQTRLSWRSTGERLAAAGYHAIALDARGHGDSDWSAEARYTQDDFVADLRSVMAALGASRPALIGASMGGITGLIGVGEGLVDAAALILVDVVPRTERAGFDRTRAFMQRTVGGFDSIDAVADALAAFRADGRRPRPEGLAKALRNDAAGRHYWHWDPRFLEGRLRDFEERPARLAACTPRVRIPAMLVRGGSSDVVSEEGAREFLALCPHAEYVNVEDAGHMITGDNNDVFGRVTLDFLARHLPARHANGSHR
jgi:non-heme chloroperoxidase